MNKRGTRLLAAAIVNRAVQDWKDAKAMLVKIPDHVDSLRVIEETERFFKSEWYSILRELAPGVIPADITWRLKK